MIAVYPGSFDPPTNGHLDVIVRASRLVDKLIVAVLSNNAKKALFTIEERMTQLKMVTSYIENVEIMSFDGLLIDFARQQNAQLIIRGLRAMTDFEYEFQMALTNRKLDSDIETLFISTSTQYLYLSSSLVKEIVKYNGNIDEMVPPEIKGLILKKVREDYSWNQ